MDADEALVHLGAARRAAEGRAAWPGWDFDAHPVALGLASGTLLWGHPAPPDPFRKWGDVHMGPARADLANAWEEIGGRVVATVRLEGVGALDAERLILHEAFHAFQQDLRPGSGVPFSRMPAYPEDDAANNALARAENAALAACLEGMAAPARCAADVVALRRARHACLAPEWRGYEAACEWSEGGAVLAEAGAHPDPVRTDILAGLRSCSRGGKDAAVARFYHTGAALGLVCAQWRSDWRARWLDPGAFPFDLVETWSAEGPGADPAEVLRRFEVAALLADEVAATVARRAEDDRILAGLAPAVELDTSRAPASRVLYDPKRLRVLPGGRRLHLGAVQQHGAGWSLEVGEDGGPVLEEAAAQRLVFRAPAGPLCPEGIGPLHLAGLHAQRAEVRSTGQGLRIIIHPAAGEAWA